MLLQDSISPIAAQNVSVKMELLTFVLQMTFGYFCVITGIAALCSIHEEWWYPNRFNRKSIDEIGLSTLAYRLVATTLLIGLEVLICIVSLLRVSFAHADAEARNQELVATVVEAVSILWIALTVATTAFAIPVAIDMSIVTKHLLSPTPSPALPNAVDTSYEDQTEVDIERLPLLLHRNHSLYCTANDDPDLARFGSTYGTLVPSSLEQCSSQSVLANSSFNSAAFFRAPRHWSPVPVWNGRSPGTDDGLRPETLFDADDEMDDGSEEGDVIGAASSPEHPVRMASTV